MHFGIWDNHEMCREARAGLAKRGALTIVELIIVVMVIGIMAVVAAPTFYESLLYHQVESAARRVKADLELAQHSARHMSATQSITFTDSVYTMSAAIAGLDDPNAAYSVDLAAAPYELTKVTASFNDSSAVSFDGYGMPSAGGTIVLQSQGHRCTVTLDGVTGEVSIASNHARGNVAAVEDD